MSRGKDLITVTVRSFIPPNTLVEGFGVGKPFKITMAGVITLGEFTQKVFSKKENQIGMIALNGQIASENTVLSEGDRIDLYPLLDGG
jgi:molybdopterin converting factor small subunit